MTLRTRRIFFWSLIPCFVVGGAAVVLYSQGYRVDAESRELTKIGAFYVRGYPRSALITLDGQRLNTGSWWPLQSGTLDGGLVPGTYRLHAEAPGHRSWDADVVIRPALVTERKSLVLFPDIAVPVPAASGTVPVGIDAPDSFDEPVLLTAADNPRAVVGDEVIPGTYLGTTNGRLALVSTVTRGRTVSQLLSLRSPDEVAATSVSLQGDAGEAPVVQDDSVLHRESPRLVAAYDGATGRRTVLASAPEGARIGAFLRTGSYDAWEEIGATSSHLVVKRRGSSDRTSFPSAGIASLQPAGSGIGALDEAGSLWLIDPGSGTRREVGHRAAYASWKDDGSAVAALIDGQLEVIPLEKDAPHGKLAGALAEGADLRSVSWYPDGEHLFVETGDELLFVDVINGEANEQHAYRMPVPGAWAYSAKEGALYVVNAGKVESYVFPD